MWKLIAKQFRSADSFVSLVLGAAVVLVIGMLAYNYITGRGNLSTGGPEGEQEGQEQVSLPTTHTVAAGETLWSIAERYYKSGYNWVDIQNANSLANANVIEVGQTLTIPTATPIVPAGETLSTSTTTPSQATAYTVVRGDSLWTIAVNHYNDGYKWVAIAQANNLVNPNVIHAGNVLTLP